ncbi:MAG: universal stress protein, partial [Deferrisomatales bacterium]
MLPEIRRILFCTQLGPNAAYIFRYAFLLAQKLGARITALHVVETLTPAQEALVEGYVGPGTLHALVEREEKSAADRLRNRLARFCAQAAGPAGCGELIEEIALAEGTAAEQ